VPCPQQDEKAKAERARKQAETQAFIKNYLEDRKRWKEEQKRKQAEEMQIIDDWNRKIEARLDALKSQKAKVRAVLLHNFQCHFERTLSQTALWKSIVLSFNSYLSAYRVFLRFRRQVGMMLFSQKFRPKSRRIASNGTQT
jgi:hypothetical protein